MPLKPIEEDWPVKFVRDVRVALDRIASVEFFEFLVLTDGKLIKSFDANEAIDCGRFVRDTWHKGKKPVSVLFEKYEYSGNIKNVWEYTYRGGEKSPVEYAQTMHPKGMGKHFIAGMWRCTPPTISYYEKLFKSSIGKPDKTVYNTLK